MKHFLWLVLQRAVSPMPILSLANLMLTYFIVLTNQLIFHDHQQDFGIEPSPISLISRSPLWNPWSPYD
jgi:hypothetical protein